MGEDSDPSARVAVITGGAGAIGGAIAAERAAAGHTVVSLDQAGDPPVDLACENQVRAAADGVLRSHGRCGVLVYTAALTGQTLCVDGGLILR